jgi:zinc transport system substrate-binding protein
MTITRLALGIVAVIATGLAFATPPSVAAQAKPLVVTTVYPLYDFTRQVAGEHARVVSLVPPGVEPHHWDPTPRDITRVQQARVFVYNGAGLEAWVDRLLPDLRRRKVVAVDASEGLPLLAADPHRARHDHGTQRGHAKKHDHAKTPDRQGNHDPHVWLDPVLAQAQVDRIQAGLAEADPGNAKAYAANAAGVKAELAALHAAYEQGLADCRRRDIIVVHAAFGYLAHRYNLRQVSVMGLTPEAEPSPADLAAIVRFAREHDVRYIFFETLVSSRLAGTLAREVGARTLVLNPLEGLTPEQAAAGETYLSLMRRNLEHLRIALECA